MARSIQEIKRTMTTAFMANEHLRRIYNIEGDKKTFDECFSAVSLENLLFYCVATCCFVLENMFETFAREVDNRIEQNVVASVAWYYNKALEFQYGSSLEFNTTTFALEYKHKEPQKQIIKYVAVRDRGSAIDILVAQDVQGKPQPVSNEVLMAFKQYINAIKVAGVVAHCYSKMPDKLMIKADIFIDPLKINDKGEDIVTKNKVVEEAIKNYVASIAYGGTFNKTRLVDAIQKIEGVNDIVLKECSYKIEEMSEFINIEGNNYTALGGCFDVVGLENSISYVL